MSDSDMEDWEVVEDLNNGIAFISDPDSPFYDRFRVWDDEDELVTVWDSNSEPEHEPVQHVNTFITCSKECLPMKSLIENHRWQGEFVDEFQRFLSPIRASDFERGASVIIREITSRIAVFKYASCYKFSETEGMWNPGTQVRKRDLFNTDDILYGSGDGAIPSYFKYFFVLSCKELLKFSDFMESVDVSQMSMTHHVTLDMKRSYKHYTTLSAIRNFRNEEFQKCLDELYSLRVQFQKCNEDLSKDFELYYSARMALILVLNEITYNRDTKISFEATDKLCRLRDFCSYSAEVYANTVLVAMEVMKSYSNMKTKLDSFNII